MARAPQKNEEDLWKHRKNWGVAESDSESDEGAARQGRDGEPPASFVQHFVRGTADDEAFLGEWASRGGEQSLVVPGIWPLERQMRFAAWCQLLGLTCTWEVRERVRSREGNEAHHVSGRVHLLNSRQ